MIVEMRLILDLLTRKDGFPEIWMPSSEQRDLRTLLRDRHQWVLFYKKGCQEQKLRL
jgi:hypothetical protein